MFAFSICGLMLLSAIIHGIESQQNFQRNLEIDSEVTSSNFLRWSARPFEERLLFEMFYPWVWFIKPIYRPFHQKLKQIYEEPTIRKNPSNSQAYNYGEVSDPNYVSLNEGLGYEKSRQSRPFLSNSGELQNIEKRDSYLLMCHFKLCNLGRKRRISGTNTIGQTGIVVNNNGRNTDI